MSLNMYGFINGDFPVDQVIITYLLKNNVDGKVVLTPDPNREVETHTLNYQPATSGEIKEFIKNGGERFDLVRRFYINDGIDLSMDDRFSMRLVKDGFLWKPLDIDCRPHRNYCKIIAGRLPNTFIDITKGFVFLEDLTVLSDSGNVSLSDLTIVSDSGNVSLSDLTIVSDSGNVSLSDLIITSDSGVANLTNLTVDPEV